MHCPECNGRLKYDPVDATYYCPFADCLWDEILDGWPYPVR